MDVHGPDQVSPPWEAKGEKVIALAGCAVYLVIEKSALIDGERTVHIE